MNRKVSMTKRIGANCNDLGLCDKNVACLFFCRVMGPFLRIRHSDPWMQMNRMRRGNGRPGLLLVNLGKSLRNNKK